MVKRTPRRVDSYSEWHSELNETLTIVTSFEGLFEQVDIGERMPEGQLWVCADAGPPALWQRLLGVKRNVDLLYALEWSGPFASLIFTDENGSEQRAIDHEVPVSPGEDVRVKIAHGELRPHPVDECMDKTRAFTALREFLRSSERPQWLKYRKVG